MPTCNHRRRPGFTLIELLIVISIIAVLLTLVTVAGYRAIIHVRQTTIAMEVNQLESAMNAYKEKYGDYPPDFSNDAVLVAHLRKAFPRNRENVANWIATYGRPDPSEALVFWLGGGVKGIGLYDNQEFPLSGPGQFKKFYDFPAARVVPSPTRATANSNFFCFVPAYGAQPAPYVYFESRTYTAGAYGNAALGYALPYGTDAPAQNIYWESPNTFQIISAGLDGNYGLWPSGTPPSQPYKFFPSGAIVDPNPLDGSRPNGTAYTKQDRDNITSFAEGTLDSKLP